MPSSDRAPVFSVSKRRKTLLGYALMLLLTLGAFLWIRAEGETLKAPPLGDVAVAVARRPSENVLLHVLLSLVVVIIASRALGGLFKRVRQPPVIGEVLAGILLGPSLLGRVAPEVQAFLLPVAIAPYLAVIAQVGIILFMFLVGLELDMSLLSKRSHVTLAISHSSIVVPFVLGSALALWLYPLLSSEQVGFTNFALFMGVAMSVTAFPVLARILTDQGMQRSELGTIALACAAVDDATAWCLLAVIVGIVRASTTSSLWTLGLTFAYVLLMLGVARPLIARLAKRESLNDRLSQRATAAVLVGLLVSALVTEAIGIHALFGAFLLGAVVPHESRLARELTERLEDFVIVLLLPAFFAFTGLRTQIGLLSGVMDWVYCGVILLVACVGKFGGSTLAARLTGMPWREASALGVLMNTRGLMELIVLHVGLDLGVISPRLFAMLVIMAVVTTLATSPLLHALKLGGARTPALACGNGGAV